MYIVDPISDVIYWLFEDGSWVSDTAQDGPIGTGAKRWLQTFEQKIAARRKKLPHGAKTRKTERMSWPMISMSITHSALKQTSANKTTATSSMSSGSMT
ncbi:hypothetical protein [Corynebacterium casei]|uniref:hypothetical protein n=1 Tax=Corynebacterium casei TaxID=160386 RepID=UPI003F9B8CCD